MIQNKFENDFLKLLHKVWSEGELRSNRTGTQGYSLWGAHLDIDLREGYPLPTSKFVSFKNVAEELLWFLRGESNVRSLQERGVKIWDPWAKEDGEVGPIYGVQWTKWRAVNDSHDVWFVNQIKNVVESIRTNPTSRRHVVSAWNPADLELMALPPCHMMFQFNAVSQQGRHWLDCAFVMRSCDVFIGLPYNIASYALLCHMVAHCTGREARRLLVTLHDAHLYSNHVEAAREQLSRGIRSLPYLHVKPDASKNIFEMKYEDFVLSNYKSHPAIKVEVAV